jgi:hypothetical protein
VKLRQPARGQLRLLRKAEMPKAPLERELVDAIRALAHKMGLIQWSGRIFVLRGKPPYLPILGPGTPDVLILARDGRLLGIEAKRDESSQERQSQVLWRAQFPTVKVAVVRSTVEAYDFLKAHA